MNILGFGNEKMPSVINDPFAKNNITRIYVSMAKDTFMDKQSIRARGSVEFTNGNTKGEQEFTGETFDEVVLKIKSCIDNM